LIVFEDESGVSLLPSVRATWAPRGCTPVLRHRFAWKRLSLAGALAYEPDGSTAHLVFELRPGAYNDETLIEFLTFLNEHEQRPVLLIWDGLPSHRSRRMSEWIASQRHWLFVEPLPGYAPDVNPSSGFGAASSRGSSPTCAPTRSTRLPTLRKRASIVLAATLHSASPSCATPASVYDQHRR